jgi:hypothetical protein
LGHVCRHRSHDRAAGRSEVPEDLMRQRPLETAF